MYLPSAATLAVGLLTAAHLTSYIGYSTPAVAFGPPVIAPTHRAVTRFAYPTLRACRPNGYSTRSDLFDLSGSGGFQQLYMTVQTVLSGKSLATAITMLNLLQKRGGAAALAVAQAILVRELIGRVDVQGVGMAARDALFNIGALNLIEAAP